MRRFIFIPILVFTMSCSHHETGQTITTGTLLNEMVDLKRLTHLPDESYKTIQFSSYDRRSTKSSEKGWFSNEDGFGKEPIPGFDKVLREPDTAGIGEYLICDIQKPGAIVRLWTAGIDGKIRLFLDDMNSPFYEGTAQDFFWKTIETLSDSMDRVNDLNAFRQFDATYFPIPFSKRCRIEWIGDIRKIHFYHVGIRVYDSDVNIETFRRNDFSKYLQLYTEINKTIITHDSTIILKDKSVQNSTINLEPGSKKELFRFEGESHAIEYFSVKLSGREIENALRQTVLSIYFDESSIMQVNSPLGDFFGAAPGINPFQSIPFSVQADGKMICRFVMPYKHSVKIEIENNSTQNIQVNAEILTNKFIWEEGKTMHFMAGWKISHGLTASYFDEKTNSVPDILYMMASGQGRIVGAAAYIYNPSNAITSWGNWWGEGDEKIYTDQDTFPSFFGTGSEDYFNYSWSSRRIFSYPYCGQPRNDGPGNRGYVSNFRWHILDDILFKDKIAFFMELGHHGIVPGFSYGRIVYYYALPGLINDYQKISPEDIREVTYKPWKPLAYCGSAGFRFIQAENLSFQKSNTRVEKGRMWSEENILIWTPTGAGEKIKFQFNSKEAIPKTPVGFTMAHCPEGGIFSVFINGKPVRIDGKDSLNLFEPDQQILANHFSETMDLKKGINEIVFESLDTKKGGKVGLDFIWLKEQ